MAARQQYVTAGAFRSALEARLNERAHREGVDLHRLRRQVTFDRPGAHVRSGASVGDSWVASKAAMPSNCASTGLGLRRISTSPSRAIIRSAARSISLRERLQLAASIELTDFFTFIVGEPMAELNEAPEGGGRFPIDARLDGRTFVKFHVDLGVGDDVLEPLQPVTGEDWLGIAGIPPVVAPALSVEQHWAESLMRTRVRATCPIVACGTWSISLQSWTARRPHGSA